MLPPLQGFDDNDHDRDWLKGMGKGYEDAVKMAMGKGKAHEDAVKVAKGKAGPTRARTRARPTRTRMRTRMPRLVRNAIGGKAKAKGKSKAAAKPRQRPVSDLMLGCGVRRS